MTLYIVHYCCIMRADTAPQVSLGTSKINYMDPRISVAWCKRNEVPIERIFAKTLRDKFVWAMNVPPDWRFDFDTLNTPATATPAIPAAVAAAAASGVLPAHSGADTPPRVAAAVQAEVHESVVHEAAEKLKKRQGPACEAPARLTAVKSADNGSSSSNGNGSSSTSNGAGSSSSSSSAAADATAATVSGTAADDSDEAEAEL
jgi:C-terminal topoisomerase domain